MKQFKVYICSMHVIFFMLLQGTMNSYVYFIVSHIMTKVALWPYHWYMNGISINDVQFFRQNDYQHHLRQIHIFKNCYITGICQSCWYVFSICQKKIAECGIQCSKYGFWYMKGIWKLYKSFFQTQRYAKWYMRNLVYMCHLKKSV